MVVMMMMVLYNQRRQAKGVRATRITWTTTTRQQA